MKNPNKPRLGRVTCDLCNTSRLVIFTCAECKDERGAFTFDCPTGCDPSLSVPKCRGKEGCPLPAIAERRRSAYGTIVMAPISEQGNVVVDVFKETGVWSGFSFTKEDLGWFTSSEAKEVAVRGFQGENGKSSLAEFLASQEKETPQPSPQPAAGQLELLAEASPALEPVAAFEPEGKTPTAPEGHFPLGDLPPVAPPNGELTQPVPRDEVPPPVAAPKEGGVYAECSQGHQQLFRILCSHCEQNAHKVMVGCGGKECKELMLLTLSCANCGLNIPVSVINPAAPAPAAPTPSTPVASNGTGRKYRLRMYGEPEAEASEISFSVLKEKILKKELGDGRDWFVAKNGNGKWKRASEVPELTNLFEEMYRKNLSVQPASIPTPPPSSAVMTYKLKINRRDSDAQVLELTGERIIEEIMSGKLDKFTLILNPAIGEWEELGTHLAFAAAFRAKDAPAAPLPVVRKDWRVKTSYSSSHTLDLNQGEVVDQIASGDLTIEAVAWVLDKWVPLYKAHQVFADALKSKLDMAAQEATRPEVEPVVPFPLASDAELPLTEETLEGGGDTMEDEFCEQAIQEDERGRKEEEGHQPEAAASQSTPVKRDWSWLLPVGVGAVVVIALIALFSS